MTNRNSLAKSLPWILVTGMGFAAQSAFAAPALDIPYQAFEQASGSTPVANTEVLRNKQFFDNASGAQNGGGVAGTDAIFGRISNFTYDQSGKVSAFQITATITNDLPGSGTWTATNAHQESLTGTALPAQTMHHTVLSTLFADDGVLGNFNVGGPNVGPESNIYGINYNKLAWYSYPSTGSYQVPTWDFGNIELGQSVTRVLDFGLYNAVDVSYFDALYDWNNTSNYIDVFTSKTSNLKLGTYNSPLVADNGLTSQRSDVAVFFTPEPSVLLLLAPALIGLGLSRRKSV